MAEVGMGTLYEINKSVIKKQGKLNKSQIKTGINVIEQYFKDTKNTYYMLLCHDRKDFSIFNISLGKYAEAAYVVKECFDNREATLYSITKDENGGIEIWAEIKEEKELEMFCYYLFPYDNGLIEI